MKRFYSLLCTSWMLAALLLTTSPVVTLAQDAEQKEEPADEQGMRKFWNRFRRPSIYQRSHDSVKEPFAEVISRPVKSTVRVLVKGDQAALGAIVDGKGLILTKASELRSRERLECELFDGRRLSAQQVGLSEDYDLALLQISAADLPAVEWVETESPVGAWLVTPGAKHLPVSIGVVSTAARKIPKSRALLGVRLGPNPADAKGGARVGLVFPNSGAQRAGVEVGDLIIGADDAKIATPEDLIAHVSGMLPGDQVRLKIKRGDDDEKWLTAELSDQEALSQSRVETQNSLGGPISRRRSGFPRVIQHDSVLRPDQCGGPLVNLSGEVVGLNIARAGRVASYAVPATEVLRLLPALVTNRANFRADEYARQLARIEERTASTKQQLETYQGGLKVAQEKAKSDGEPPSDEVVKARKDVAKFTQLIKEARDRLDKLNAEAAKIREQTQVKTP